MLAQIAPTVGGCSAPGDLRDWTNWADSL